MGHANLRQSRNVERAEEKTVLSLSLLLLHVNGEQIFFFKSFRRDAKLLGFHCGRLVSVWLCS